MSQQKPDENEIRQTLIQLHDELERTHTLDENERVMMRHLMNDIQEILDRPEQEDKPRYQANSPLVDQLEQAVSELEVSHPTLSGVIQKALDILNIAGI